MTEIKALNLSVDEDRKLVELEIRKVLDAHFGESQASFAGFALVVWDLEGHTARVVVKDGCKIPIPLVPEYVKSILLTEQIKWWTLESIEEKPGAG